MGVWGGGTQPDIEETNGTLYGVWGGSPLLFHVAIPLCACLSLSLPSPHKLHSRFPPDPPQTHTFTHAPLTLSSPYPPHHPTHVSLAQHRLDKDGCIESFLGRVNGKAVVCIRLLKPYAAPNIMPVGGGKRRAAGGGGGGGGEADEEEEDAAAGVEEEEDGGGPGGSNLTVEVPLARQMVEVIARAGPAGLGTTEVCVWGGIGG